MSESKTPGEALLDLSNRHEAGVPEPLQEKFELDSLHPEYTEEQTFIMNLDRVFDLLMDDIQALPAIHNFVHNGERVSPLIRRDFLYTVLQKHREETNQYVAQYLSENAPPYPLTDYSLDQWWVKELENVSIGRPLSPDQVRACAVALNLARLVLGKGNGK